MSTMATPEAVPGRVLAEILTCDQCEPERRPRMFVCDYHAGWWDGWEAHDAAPISNRDSRTEGADQ